MYYYTLFFTAMKNKLIDKTAPGEILFGCTRAVTYMRVFKEQELNVKPP